MERVEITDGAILLGNRRFYNDDTATTISNSAGIIDHYKFKVATLFNKVFVVGPSSDTEMKYIYERFAHHAVN